MAVKTSILAFYLIVTHGEKVFRWANYLTLAVVNLAGLALTLVNIFQCTPVSAVFLSTTPPGAKCIDIMTLYLSSAPVNIITDLAILVLPMPILTKMHLPRKQKLTLVITFGFGFFVAVVDVIRIVFFQRAAISRQLAIQSVQTSKSGSLDFSCMRLSRPILVFLGERWTWLIGQLIGYGSLSFMWSVVEVNVSVICGCVPLLKPLVARLLPTLIRDTEKSRHTSQTSPNTRSSARQNAVVVPSRAAVRSPTSSLPPSLLSASSDSELSQHMDGSIGRSTERRDSNVRVTTVDSIGPLGSGPQDEEANTASTGVFNPEITFLDFVNLRNPKSMLMLNNKESIAPNALITLLFFLWGCAYGFLNVLNTQFQNIVRLNAWYSLGLHGAYFGGYAVGPLLVGRPVLNTWGFKSTFITGLCIYGCGALIFWPSAVLTSPAAFTVSNFIVGCGLGILETAANPFISICGPLENAEIRLTLSQGVQAIGSVVSPLLAQKVLFKSVKDVASLVNVQWTYLGIAFFDILLAVAIYYLPVPEASDESLEQLANRRREVNMTKVAGIPVVWLTLALGVWSQFFYVAGQEVLSASLKQFVISTVPNSSVSPFEFLTIGHSVFAIGRFLAALALFFLKPRWVLMTLYVGMIVFSVLCLKTTGSAAVAMSMVVYLFESGAFSIIFALSLRGTARHTKTAASMLAAAISGGVYFPFAQHAAYISHGMSYSFCVLVALFSAGSVFPIYLNLVPAAKKQVDPVLNE